MKRLVSQALDLQLDLHRYYTSGKGAAYAETIAEALLEDEADDEQKSAYRRSGAAMHRIMTMGETFVVTRDICDVLEVASATIPPHALRHDDAPVETGFVHLERPILFPDIKGRQLVVKAFAWTQATRQSEGTPGGLAFLMWTVPSDDRDHLHHEHVFQFEVERLKQIGAYPPGGLYSLLGGLWEWGTVPPPTDTFHRLCQTFFRFVDEPWITAARERPDRPTVRRAQRAEMADPYITVVQLRRPKVTGREPGAGGTVEWSHRWIRRGHWMNAWCPSINDHRPVWRRETVCGPTDKPLIVSDKVFLVRR